VRRDVQNSETRSKTLLEDLSRSQRTYELVRGDLFENGAEVAEGVLAGADGEQEDEEHWYPHRPCHHHGVP
jgi:hypothetical protein